MKQAKLIRLMSLIGRAIVEESTRIAATIGGFCLVLALAFWHGGVKDSHDAQIMAENLGKGYAGGGWYPANGTDYDLEALVIGHDGWVTEAVNAECGDQIMVRLRIASGSGVSFVQAPDNGISEIHRNSELSEIASETDYASPDSRHIAYIPIGTYTIEDSIWSHETGVYSVGVTYDGPDGAIYREVIVVPPNSEIDFRAVLSFIIAGLVCFLLFVPVTVFIRRRYSYS